VEAWFRSYITSVLERDVRDLSNIEGLKSLPNLLALIASRNGGLLNMSDLARSFQLTDSTLKRYLVLLEMVYLVVALQPWSRNLGKRLVKSPKLFLNDTGLLCHLLECNAAGLEKNRQLFGFVFENFVLMELIKQIAWSKTQPKALHFRTLAGQEVDIVLESRSGKVVGIECKASSSVNLDSFKGIKALTD
jgi:predicted AAA+ superfamily ATPase